MNEATLTNYRKHFGPDAHQPGYCGKCPGAGMIGNDPVCTVFAEDAAERILERDGAPPDWCPILSISTRYATPEKGQTE